MGRVEKQQVKPILPTATSPPPAPPALRPSVKASSVPSRGSVLEHEAGHPLHRRDGPATAATFGSAPPDGRLLWITKKGWSRLEERALRSTSLFFNICFFRFWGKTWEAELMLRSSLEMLWRAVSNHWMLQIKHTVYRYSDFGCHPLRWGTGNLMQWKHVICDLDLGFQWSQGVKDPRLWVPHVPHLCVIFCLPSVFWDVRADRDTSKMCLRFRPVLKHSNGYAHTCGFEVKHAECCVDVVLAFAYIAIPSASGSWPHVKAKGSLLMWRPEEPEEQTRTQCWTLCFDLRRFDLILLSSPWMIHRIDRLAFKVFPQCHLHSSSVSRVWRNHVAAWIWLWLPW